MTLNFFISESPVNFSELKLHPELMRAIDGLGFQSCTPVQEHTIPALLEGKDVAGLAQTGTGKTAAFLLPMMERILRARERKGSTAVEPAPDIDSEDDLSKRAFPDWGPLNFILVLVPTRELAEQVYENAVKFGDHAGLRAVSIYGGVGYDKQKDALRGGVEFVIATPGRLIDLYKDNTLDLKQVRAIIFDEADRMFDMGFKEDMKFILSRVPRDRQFCVYSATLNLDVMNTAYQFGANPVEFNVSRDQTKAENVDDKILHVGQDEKGALLLALFQKVSPKQAIVFSNFKMNVPRIAQFLTDNGVPAVGISSLLTQSQRNRVMEQFKGDSDKNVLVATDVAARGLDIKGVDLVVNFELPDDPENYVHRIGRTGRAGATGTAYSLVSDRDIDALTRIEGYLKTKLSSDFIDEADIPKAFKAMTSDRSTKDFSREFKGGRPSAGGPDRGRPTGPRHRPSDRRDSQGPNENRPISAKGPKPISANEAKGVRSEASEREHGRSHLRSKPKGSGPTHRSKGPRPIPRADQARESRFRANGPKKPSPIRPVEKQSGSRSGSSGSASGIGGKVASFFKRLLS